ncbi:hypothetical protein [Amycolatopsis sp. NPDC102389]|uniref:hypothetical protein n=1 Tax=Amycolatopsis sp. NPDC102389 TaxID=3363941 RepID=UPI00382FF699
MTQGDSSDKAGKDAVSPDPAKVVDAKAESDESDPAGLARATRLRRGAAFLLVVLLVLLAMLSYRWPAFEICRDTAAANSSVVTLCNPWTTQDLVPFIVLVGFLLLPDLSELNIFNLISIKREVKSAKAEAEVIKARQEALEVRFASAVSQVSSQQTSVVNHSHFYNDQRASELPGSIDKKVHDIDERHGGSTSDDPVNGGQHAERTPDRETEPVESRDRVSSEESNGSTDASSVSIDMITDDVLKLGILNNWEQLSEGLQLGSYYRISQDSFTPARRRFLDLFKEEIGTVRAVRNSIAHAKPVSREDLIGAYDAVRQLNKIWRESAATLG